ncbi:hypothetical protein C8J31_105149 [Rhizobium sp. PP-CC-2G-626]|nr:hypothetical protein C8J31_105149 [Rhizobium sp. PP-CC-2G-626]
MPKSVDFIVDDLHTRLQRSGREVGTMLWPDVYRDYEIDRWKQPRGEAIKEKAYIKYGLNISYSDTVLTVTVNRNFAPI